MKLRQPNELATPVRSSRQWATALSPNATGTGWNYISCCWPGDSHPLDWHVIKNITTSPAQVTYQTPTHRWPTLLGTIAQQYRAANGRIFFPSVDNYVSYYDPTTEAVGQVGPLIETPPVDPNASTSFYSARFDTAGMLYMGTGESQNRPAYIVSLDPNTLQITTLGVVGDSATGYSTYAYYIAPDTTTATKFIYVVYGQSPWQLWALNITTGATTKLAQVASSGSISFSLQNQTQGWTVTIHTNLGAADNVTTRYWCLDGALYPLTGSTPPVGAPAGRNITPYANPLVNAPQVDVDRGAGQVLWRANGSAGDWTLVEYDVNNRTDCTIESVLPLSDGTVLGNAENYQGFFRYDPATATSSWYGTWTSGVSQPVLVEVGDEVYISGYPNCALHRYDPSLPWVAGTNPVSLGTFHATAATHFTYFLEHDGGRLYMLGRRERTGVGSGLAYYDIAAATYTGTSADLTFGNPQGLVVLPDIRRVVASLKPLDGSAGVLVVFDYSLTEVARWTVNANWTDLGKLYACADGRCVVGVTTTHSLAYRFDVVVGSLRGQAALGGAVGSSTQPERGGEILVNVDTEMKSVDPNTLTTTRAFAGYSGVGKVAAGKVVYFSNGAKLYQQSKITNSSRTARRRWRPWWE